MQKHNFYILLLVFLTSNAYQWITVPTTSQAPTSRMNSNLFVFVPAGCKRSDQVLVFGGTNAQQVVLQQLYNYDWTAKVWKSMNLSDTPNATQFATLSKEPYFVQDEKHVILQIVYFVYGGARSKQCSDTLHAIRYQISDNTYAWENVAQGYMQVHSAGDMVVFQDKLYWFGGWNCKTQQPSNVLLIYDISMFCYFSYFFNIENAKWSSKVQETNWPSARYGHTFTQVEM